MGLFHGSPADLVLLAQLDKRRQPVAGFELAASDIGAELIGQIHIFCRTLLDSHELLSGRCEVHKIVVRVSICLLC